MATKKKVEKNKKKSVVKTPTKKEVENIKLKLAKGELEHKKRVYGEFIKVLVKYNIKNVAYSAIMYDELHSKSLERKMESLIGKPGELHKLVFGECDKTELERLNSNIEYYDKLISIAQSNIEQMQDDVKTKIAKDAIEKQYGWLNILE